MGRKFVRSALSISTWGVEAWTLSKVDCGTSGLG